jgi:hypothetical protein
MAGITLFLPHSCKCNEIKSNEMTKRRDVVVNTLHILGVLGSIFEKKSAPNLMIFTNPSSQMLGDFTLKQAGNGP